MEEVLVKRSELGTSKRNSKAAGNLSAGEVRVQIEKIGLSSNNVSYASAGDFLGYWLHFSYDSEWGVVHVWVFAKLIESQCPDVFLGERIFGFLPMASEAVFKPSDISPLCFTDASEQRSGLHPWYTRLYRCGGDPVFSEENMNAQPLLWALFMTGWMMADELNGKVDTVFVSSASSKTAISLGWALKSLGAESVGITSSTNRSFVEGLDLYDQVVTYDELSNAKHGDRCAYVDIAGNAKVTSDMHVLLGDALVDSVLIGSTHQAPSAEQLPMPGTSPRFFFIPDVAEQKAEAMSFEAYHQAFAAAWSEFSAWSLGWLEFEQAVGAEAVEAGYLRNVNESIAPQTALMFSWS